MKRSLWNPQGQAETSSLQNVLRTDTACFPLSQGRWQSHCGAPTGRREGAAVDVLLHVPQASLLEPQELIQQALKAQGPGRYSQLILTAMPLTCFQNHTIKMQKSIQLNDFLLMINFITIKSS